MDILYHGIVGFTIGKTLGGSPAAGVIAATLPDLIGTTPYFYRKIQKVSRESLSTFTRDFIQIFQANKFVGEVDRIFYQTTHSLVFTFLVFLIAYEFFQSAWIVIGLSYLSHIAIDIPTHDGDFATYVFYPFSHFHWERKNWATNPGIFFTFWGILLTIIFFLGII